MQLQTLFFALLSAASTITAASIPRAPFGNGTLATPDPRFIPTDFGVTAGVPAPSQPGSCLGAGGKLIPCTCPPKSTDPRFLAGLTQALTEGFFPDPSVQSPINLARFNDAADTSTRTSQLRATVMIQVMQSLSGKKGAGCPGVAVPVLVNQQKTGQVGDAASVGSAGR
ncbi:hypothetical protein B0T19DRAFT_296651 [Cercophora scortea]|uniref:Uncharacterized protein n=1 Tax=Cercophora scortea TaxID=314031 RepID=A0AAE0I356_9PEZI|nr:hypothetical protein B0T19DRAFT_296651 [Cercophora scortea]